MLGTYRTVGAGREVLRSSRVGWRGEDKVEHGSCEATEAALPDIRIGVSACLMGSAVRFDGGHKRDRFLTDTLGGMVRFVTICPEVEIGLGTPRESIRLVRGGDGSVRLVGPRSGRDLTETMELHARQRVRELREHRLHGFIVKSGSPSCGLERVRVYEPSGIPAKLGAGVFTRVLRQDWPLLPVEEDGRLRDPRLRENFFARVFCHARLQTLFGGAWTLGELVCFHAGEKLLLMAHDPQRARALGQWVARGSSLPRAELANGYERLAMEALSRVAGPAAHVNVLQHILGYFRGPLESADRRELHALVDEFRRGLVPLVVPLTLIQHHVRRLGLAYLAAQTYLNPHPRALALRSSF